MCSFWDQYSLFRDKKDHYFHPKFEQKEFSAISKNMSSIMWFFGGLRIGSEEGKLNDEFLMITI